MSSAPRIGRRALLLATGAGVAAAGFAGTARAGDLAASEPANPGDRAIFKYLYDAEYIQVALYAHARSIHLDRTTAAFARDALRRQRAHVRMLDALNRRIDVVVNGPTIFNFGDMDRTRFLRDAKRIEDAAVAGAGTALTLLENQQHIDPLMLIATDEATHAGVVAELLGLAPSHTPFDEPQPLADMRQILTIAY